MRSHLKLVSDNPAPPPRERPDGIALRRLAEELADDVRAGHADVARGLAARHKLSPFGIAIVAARMAKAGLDEAQILRVVA